jgi:hypothetical protein
LRRNFFSNLGSRVGRRPVIEDPRHFIAERSMHDERMLEVISLLDKAALEEQLAHQGGWQPMSNADGIYYRDSRQPWCIAAQTSITLAATDKLLYPGAMTALVSNYFTPGKGLKLTVMGAFTTAATPGNLGVEHYFGTADAGGTLLGSSAAVALTLNKTSFTAILESYCRCRSSGTTGAVISWGRFMSDGAGLLTASASNPVLTPQALPAQTTIDTTGASGYNIQVKRSGSTAETFVTHDIVFEALN